MNQRYVFLDYTRIIAAYLVVLGHLLPVSGNVVKSFIYSFHISLFFLISGMLYKYNGQVQLQKYIKTILFPALFFYFVIGTLLGVMGYYSLFGMDYERMYSIEKTSDLFTSLCFSSWFDLKKLFWGCYGTNGPCWFLYALLLLKIFTDISLKNKRTLIVCLLLCPVMFVFSKYIINPLSLGRAMLAYPFYLIGYFFKDNIIRCFSDNFIKNNSIFFMVVFMAISLGCLYLNHQPSYSTLDFGILPLPINIVFFYLAGISGTFMVMSFCSKWRNNIYVDSIAKSLITIVGVQALFFKPILSMWGRNMNLGIYIIVAVIITLLCWFVHLILSKTVPFLIGK